MAADRRVMELAEHVAEVREDYERDRAVFIEGARIVRIARLLGASSSDLDELASAGGTLPADPTLPFRRSRNARFEFDVSAREVRRLAHQPFVLFADDDFVRHDSGQLREFDEIGDGFQRNPAVAALLAFHAAVVDSMRTTPRPNLDYTDAGWICTMFHLRTVTTAELIGEPALEGVHSDGVDHTMTTLLAAENMTEDSAVTCLHDVRESTGIPWHRTADRWRLGTRKHSAFLDTLLIADHERKHSLSPVRARDSSRPATRDMLILFTRKPMLPRHVGYPYDSRAPHAEISFTVALPVPALAGRSVTAKVSLPLPDRLIPN